MRYRGSWMASFACLAVASLSVAGLLSNRAMAQTNATCSACNQACMSKADVQLICTHGGIIDSACMSRWCISYCFAKGECPSGGGTLVSCASADCSFTGDPRQTICTNDCFGKLCNTDNTSLCGDTITIPADIRRKWCISITSLDGCKCVNPCWLNP